MEEPKHKLHLRSIRLEALGDGIFAVAMTILVIELKWPELNDTSFTRIYTIISYILPSLFCYVISFIVLVLCGLVTE